MLNTAGNSNLSANGFKGLLKSKFWWVFTRSMPSARAIALPFAAVLALVSTGSGVQATWYSENIESGADIIMMDLRWPWWPSGTYYANWNSSFNPKPNNISFYAGFTATVPDGPGFLPNPDPRIQEAFRPGSVWSFWGSSRDGTPVRFVDVAPNLFIRNVYGGEGLSGTLGGEGWPFVKSKRWYTMLARVWQPAGDASNAYVGRWIKDHADGRWHLIGMARLPIPATSFAGNSGFIESLSGEKVVRPLHRRFGYYRKDGKWQKSDTIAIDKTEYVVVNTVPEDDHEYAAIEYSNRPDLIPQQLSGKPLPGDKRHVFTVKQPDTPSLDKPALANVRAETNGKQIAVLWEIPDTASPAFAYKIEIFDNAECRGKAKAVKEERMPSARHALVDAAVPEATVRLTVTDIFDQAAPAVTVVATPSKPALQPAQPGATVTGLSYELFHNDSTRKVNYFYDPLQNPKEEHHWLTLDEIRQGKRVRSGLSRGFDIGVREQRSSGYAIVFNGFLRVPEDGFYLLHAQIDGAFRMQLDGNDALTWDGQHGTTEKAALCGLSKGEHSISVTHLFDRLPASNFSIEWEGRQLSRQPIPVDSLRVKDEESYPSPTIKADAAGDGTGRVTVSVDGRGHVVNKVTLFLGQLQLAESSGPALTYAGAMPRGENKLWCRVIFDGSHSVDSAPATVEVAGKPVDQEWTVRNVGDAKASAGLWQTGAKAFQFFGNGMHTVSKRMTGDFTATCRIVSYNGSHGEPVNRRAWVGLGAFEYGERLNWEWGQHFYVVQTAADGMRASADYSDLGAGRISSYELPKNHAWIRIARQGNVWMAWSSADGKQWELGAYQFKRAQPQMDVGLFFSALPQEARAHYHASVSDFDIQPGLAADSVPPLPAVARHTDGQRLTGVVMARSDPQVVVVRSTSAGLIRTTDGGRTWAPANGGLDGDDLSVRSVAIHPEDPLVMLRACGRGAGTGSLWKTNDGGKNWTKLGLDGDFDGVGPSALCGEVVSFDLRAPQIIYVGCESKGFFKSPDGGATWTKTGLTGERVTAVTVWPWERHYPAVAQGKTHLCVTTCADQWMHGLGRGKPATATTGNFSRSYVSNNNVKSLDVMDERFDTGFFNVTFDKATQSSREMCYATAHGFQHNSGGHMSLFPERKNVEWLRPITALGATAIGDQKFGRFITQALDPVTSGRLSRSERWAFEWSWLSCKGMVPQGGLIAVCGDQSKGDSWWFVYSDGLYNSVDGGATLTKVMSELGKQ